MGDALLGHSVRYSSRHDKTRGASVAARSLRAGACAGAEPESWNPGSEERIMIFQRTIDPRLDFLDSAPTC